MRAISDDTYFLDILLHEHSFESCLVSSDVFFPFNQTEWADSFYRLSNIMFTYNIKNYATAEGSSLIQIPIEAGNVRVECVDMRKVANEESVNLVKLGKNAKKKLRRKQGVLEEVS